MKTYNPRLFLLVFSLITLILIALLVCSDKIIRPLSVLDFSRGWEYSWDELPRDSFDNLIWNYERIDRLDWESMDFPSNPPDRDGRSLVWFRISLPQEKFRDPVLFIFSIDINAEFFIDGERIHSFGSIDRNGRGAFIGWSAQLIELPPDSQGSEMFVRVFSDYYNIGLWGDILIGNKADLIAYMYRKDLCGLTVLIISLLIGLVFLASYFLSKNQRVSLYLSIISILLAIRIFGRLYVSHFTFTSPMLPVYIDAGTSALIPFFIIFIFRSFLEDMFRGLTSVLIYICIGIVLASLVIFSVPGIPVYTVYDVLDAGMTSGLLLLVYVSIRCLERGT